MFNENPAFLIYKHTLFNIGKYYDENEINYNENILFHYPEDLQKNSLVIFLKTFVSFFTYINNSIHDDDIQIMGFESFKVTTSSIIKDNDTSIFFILMLPNNIPDQIIKNLLLHIKEGVYFILGKSFTQEMLLNYFQHEGKRILYKIFHSESSLLSLCFNSIQIANWELGSSFLSLISSSLHDLKTGVIGFSCSFDTKFLISEIHPSLLSLLIFLPQENRISLDPNLKDNDSYIYQQNIFVSKDERDSLYKFKSLQCFNDNSDCEIVECLMFIIEIKNIQYHIIIDKSSIKNVDDSWVRKISKQIFQIIFPSFEFISKNFVERPAFQFPENSVSYNEKTRILHAGKVSNTFGENIFQLHSNFHDDKTTQEFISSNMIDFVIGKKSDSSEHYAFIEGLDQSEILVFYNKLENLNYNMKIKKMKKFFSK